MGGRRIFSFWILLAILLQGCLDEDGLFSDSAKRRNRAEEKKKQVEAETVRKGVEKLIQKSSEAAFDQELDQISHSGERLSVVVLTKAMLALPYEKDMETRRPQDVRMRKLKVARELDRIVPVPEREQLSARYFRALHDGQGPVKEAEKRLLKWSEDNKDYLVWDSYVMRFKLKPHERLGTIAE